MGRVVIPGFRKIETSVSGEGGTTNYNDLENKPSINNVPLVGNLNTVNLKLTDATLTEEGVPAEAKTVGTKLEEQSTSLTALSEQLGNHTVKSDVPENAVFTDTIYDDTEVKESIDELNSNLSQLEFGEVAGGKNLFNKNSSDNVDGYLVNGVPNGATYYGQKTSHFIEINSHNFVYNLGNTNNHIAFYDSNRAFINQIHQNDGINIVEIPTNAKYVRVVYFDGEKDLVQIEKGTTATSYEPYIPSVKMLAEDVKTQNSNLDSLGYGENGAYNLLNPTLQTTTISGVTCTSNGDGTYTLNGSTESFPPFRLGDVYLEKGTYLIDSFSYDGNNPYLWVGKDGENNNIINSYWTEPFTFTLDSKTLVSIHMVCVPGQNFSDKLMFPMLIKGTSAQKQYKPYIPSVKMLADEVSAQNESLDDYGLDNKSNNEWKQGYYDEEFNIVNSNGHICIGIFTCNGGDLVNIKTFKSYKQITVRYDNGSVGGDGSITTPHNEIEIIVPSGVTSFGVYVSNDVPITPSDGGNISVYVNNAIEQIKNDLDKLNSLPIGSIIQIEADKDNIETTTQKYGWQYLGTSNIECNDGALMLLVTNVYRKNN